MVTPERMWTPWRMRYLSGDAKPPGCVFCQLLDDDNDVTSLILHRAEHCFVVMNLFPYGSGHIMIVPNQHTSEPAALDPVVRHEMADLLPFLMDVLRTTLTCEGFNSGFNFGESGGAGIAEHLHQHIVPRWRGDANFMPIIASTKVMPETLPVGYAKIRAEIERAMGSAVSIPVLALTEEDRSMVLVDRTLPTATPKKDQSVWRSAVATVSDFMTEIEVAGWAGPFRAGPGGDTGLVVRGRLNPGHLAKVVSIDDAESQLSPEHMAFLTRGLTLLAPLA
ncbi:MAG: HIT domain-containing protein [Thermomicrobiales bacterium]